MAVTINVNELSLCHQSSDGVSTATLPDVCKTPSPGGPVPVPYPNVALSRALARGTKTVRADGGNSCAVQGSEFSRSTGDEPGTLGGVKSGTFRRQATWITYSMDIRFEGKGVCRLTDKMFHNANNTINAAGEIQRPLRSSRWTMRCILRILCAHERAVVERAKQLKVIRSGPIIFDDHVYRNGKWTTEEFEAGGTSGGGEINLLDDMTCEDAATTLYHEVIHADQTSGTFAEREYEAYAKTEAWTIERGLPSQASDGSLRELGSDGKARVSMDGVKAYVHKYYPVPQPGSGGSPPPPEVVKRSPDGKTVTLSDGTQRPVREGDMIPGDERPTKKQVVPPHKFKCP